GSHGEDGLLPIAIHLYVFSSSVSPCLRGEFFGKKNWGNCRAFCFLTARGGGLRVGVRGRHCFLSLRISTISGNSTGERRVVPVLAANGKPPVILSIPGPINVARAAPPAPWAGPWSRRPRPRRKCGQNTARLPPRGAPPAPAGCFLP